MKRVLLGIIFAALLMTMVSETVLGQVIGYWPFSGNANDASGNGHNGTVSGATMGQDMNGNSNSAYWFDGIDDYISVPSSAGFGPSSGIIVDVWIYPTAYPDLVGTGWEYHKSILHTTTDAYGFQMTLMDDHRVIFGIAPYPWVLLRSQSTMPLNQWTHLRGTYESSTGIIRLFVNDLLETQTISTNGRLGASGVVIGKNPRSTMPSRPFAFAGAIDEVRISAYESSTAGDPIIWEDWESGSVNSAKWTQHGAGAHISNNGYQSSHSAYFGSTNWGDVKSNTSYSFSDIKPEIDFWARTNGSSNWNNLGVWLEGPAGTSQVYLGIYIRPEASWRKIECFAGSQYTTVPYPLSEDNTWHHYNIVVNDDGTASFYKDGSLFWQSSPVAWTSLTTWQLRLSGYYYGANIPVLDNVALYNRGGGAPQPPVVTITSPTSLSSWEIGSSHQITWNNTGGALTSVEAFISRDGGPPWASLGIKDCNNCTYCDWTVTGPASTNCRIRIIATGPGGQAQPAVSSQFTIVGKAGFFFHISDIHVGGANCGGDQWWKDFINYVNSSNCDPKPEFVIATGDLVENGWHLVTPPGSIPEIKEASSNWNRLKEPLNYSGGTSYSIDPFGKIPIYFAPGNHDAKRDYWLSSCTISAVHRGFDAYESYVGAQYDVRGFPELSLALFSLNTGIDNSIQCLPRGTGLPEDQFNWLDDILPSYSLPNSSFHKIVFMHHPYWNLGGDAGGLEGTFLNKRGDERERGLKQVCQDYGVDLVLGGHVHNDVLKANKSCSASGVRGGVYNVNGGCWTSSDATRFVVTAALKDRWYRKIEFDKTGTITKVNLMQAIGASNDISSCCQTEANVYDDRGNHIGPTASGGFDYQIPDVYYSHQNSDSTGSGLGETVTDVSFPRSDSSDYTVVIRSLSSEPLNLELSSHSSSEESWGMREYSDVPVLPGSIVTINVRGGVIDPMMKIQDPDGSVRSIVSSTLYGNQPPSPSSAPTGGSIVAVDSGETYCATATDPDNDSVYYLFDWGDATTLEWIGPLPSGVPATSQHTWSSVGAFNVQVRVKDQWDIYSQWSPSTQVTVCIPTKCQLLPTQWYSSWASSPTGTVRAYIGNVPVGHTASNIVPSSIRLNGTVPIFGGTSRVRPSMTGFTGSVLEIAFSRQLAVQSLPQPLTNGTHTVLITGDFTDGNKFVAAVDVTLSGALAKEVTTEDESAVEAANVPTEFSLGDAYPNPFNPTTTIEFGLPAAGQVKLEVFNTLGQRVRTLVDAYMTAGTHTIEWNSADDSGNRVASGIYLYRIQAGEFSDTKKMVLMK